MGTSCNDWTIQNCWSTYSHRERSDALIELTRDFNFRSATTYWFLFSFGYYTPIYGQVDDTTILNNKNLSPLCRDDIFLPAVKSIPWGKQRVQHHSWLEVFCTICQIQPPPMICIQQQLNRYSRLLPTIYKSDSPIDMEEATFKFNPLIISYRIVGPDGPFSKNQAHGLLNF